MNWTDETVFPRSEDTLRVWVMYDTTHNTRAWIVVGALRVRANTSDIGGVFGIARTIAFVLPRMSALEVPTQKTHFLIVLESTLARVLLRQKSAPETPTIPVHWLKHFCSAMHSTVLVCSRMIEDSAQGL